jgi:transcriptional regulator with XRE-family HTH domain
MQRLGGNFAGVLAAELERRGWTQDRLAGELERIAADLGRPDVTVSQQAVSGYLRGVVPRDPVRRAALYRFVGVDPSGLIRPPVAVSRRAAIGDLRAVLHDALALVDVLDRDDVV